MICYSEVEDELDKLGERFHWVFVCNPVRPLVVDKAA